MKRGSYSLILAVLGFWSLTILPLHGHAQVSRSMQDCREGSECTAADLARALFPQEQQMRGLGLKKDESSKPAGILKNESSKPVVALKVLFETNSNVILPQYYSNLNELGKVLTQPQYATYRVQIQGHTDNVGSDRYNQMLSQKRAESVKQYLLQHFPIKSNNLTAAGYGKSDPIAPNETPEGRGKNRRVQVVNLGE